MKLPFPFSFLLFSIVLAGHITINLHHKFTALAGECTDFSVPGTVGTTLHCEHGDFTCYCYYFSPPDSRSTPLHRRI
jgi:hypothetical protein